MTIQIVNAANQMVVEQAQLVGMATQDLMTWLQKWGLDASAQAILAKSLLVTSDYKYIVQCKMSLSLPV